VTAAHLANQAKAELAQAKAAAAKPK
jgi:hypothetical protein